MAKLYPPQIEGTLPAFIEGKRLIVPFIMNKTVSWNEVKKLIIKIKNIQNNEVIATLTTTSFDKDLQQAYFQYDEDDFTIGTFYKVQIAYVDQEDEYGYYSTVGVIKYTTEPEVSIEGLQSSQPHSDARAYVGVYSQEDGDVSEKIYSYNFTIYDENGAVLETSGEKLHNHENDDLIYETSDSYNVIKALEENKIYTIVYTVTTANGVIKSSPRYRIIQQSSIPPEVEAKLVATMNEENGYVDLQLIGDKDENGVEKVGTGTFLICRSSSEDDYGTWSEVDRFALFGEAPSTHKWKDFTVQHGYTYIYSLQQYNKEYQIYSNRMLSNEIIANFEHSFLYDGKRQLKIKYNPKVSSFKETLLEQKTNTLGGKYPFFFRNGNVAYKEFPISGLISYLSDEEELFLTNEELLLEDPNHFSRQHSLKLDVDSKDYDYFNNMLDANQAYKLQAAYLGRENINSQENQIVRSRSRTTNLTDYNIVAERTFKTKVLEFLNDGKPKLFRSPGEGNFIVRLMNSSLSPDDKLNRMLHTFSTTATEIDDFNYQKLNEYKLITTDEPDTKQLRWKTANIRTVIDTAIEELGRDNVGNYISIGGENNIQSIQCQDMVPGEKIEILFAEPDNSPRIIQIGMTGAFYMEFDEPPRYVAVSKNSKQGQITYSYYGTNLHHFDTYKAIKMDDIPLMQIRGSDIDSNKDIKEALGLEDIKHKITKYYFLNFTKDHLPVKNAVFKFWIDGKQFDISETDNYQITDLDIIPEIKLGSGVVLDISIQRREIEYEIEDEVSKIRTAKQTYEKKCNVVQNVIHYNNNQRESLIQVSGGNDNTHSTRDNNTTYINKLNAAIDARDLSYNAFITALKKELEEREVFAK